MGLADMLRQLQAPRPKTKRLAMVVWATFAPYETAQDAGDGLRRASRAVFGQEGIDEHKDWMEGHIKNFLEWEAEGHFLEAQTMMCQGLLPNAYGQAF